MAKAKKTEPDDVKREKFSANCKVILTTEEIAERADKAAHALKERDEKELDMKAAAKHAKSIIDDLENRVRHLSNEVRTGATYKDVACERIYNYTTGMYSEVRTDTGETLMERKLTEAEKQKELPFEE